MPVKSRLMPSPSLLRFLRIFLYFIVIAAAILGCFGTVTMYNQLQDSSSKLQVLQESYTALQLEQTSKPPVVEVIPKPSGIVPAYHDLYPEMNFTYPEKFIKAQTPSAYLTFDDGPSPVTDVVLNVLAEQDILGTFFVVGTYLDNPDNHARLKRIVAEGHTIAIHTQTHNYSTVYASVDAYLADFYEIWNRVYEITGVKANILRFPGGSINSYNGSIYQEIIAEMTRRGFVYYDWNVSAEDAVSSKPTPVAKIIDHATRHGNSSHVVVLMHDSSSKETTATALDSIITTYKEAGYALLPLSPTVSPVTFGYPKH